jgi:putative transposase
MRYIELNPVRARMVRKPENHPWSSYRAHAGIARGGDVGPLLRDHPLYRGLGATPAARARSYCALFRQAPDAAFLAELRAATNGGWALGSARWRTKVERVAKRRATPLPPGRPAKDPDADARQGRLL